MKKMLIDDTQPEETRVVILDGNKIEDVAFESSAKKQIKGNIFNAKVVRIEPSLQAAFVDYGGNRHGFLAFGEIHPDYYNVSDEVKAEVEAEVDEIIERKRRFHAERKAEQERRKLEREQKRAEYEARQQALLASEAAEDGLEDEQTEEPSVQAEAQAPEAMVSATVDFDEATDGEIAEAADCGCDENCACRQEDGQCHCAENGHCCCGKKTDCGCDENCACRQEDGQCHCAENGQCCCDEKGGDVADDVEEVAADEVEPAEEAVEAEGEAEAEDKPRRNGRRRGARFLGRRGGKKFKVSAEAAGTAGAMVSEEVDEKDAHDDGDEFDDDNDDSFDEDGDDADFERYLEIQRKLIYSRKLYYRSAIQDVIKEGQTLLIQIVKEERGNKGAACTTYLSLAGRYCVLMPNRIKSGGVSRKITSANDRKRLKDIIKELPLADTMSLIVRTAGEDKPKEDIVKDYNYLIRTWNHIRHTALSVQPPVMIYEEGDLIKRALRDMYSKDISEVIIDGDEAYKTAKDFCKILSPNMGRKIKCRKPDELPVFQHYQVEKELDKLHNPIVQLASGGYLVINPTEALVSIDVNSGRATHEMDIEETALKTNLEAADEIAKQLRMRNLAGLVVVDFIDMDEPANNHAVEKRMKEAMKSDRSKVQIAKMSIFGLLEISRQRMHSSFVESNYVPCPYCKGQGVTRTAESGATLVLRAIEEEGFKGMYGKLIVTLPADTAVYLLNHKRRILADLEEKYGLEIIISADSAIKNIADYRIEKIKATKPKAEPANAPAAAYAKLDEDETDFANDDEEALESEDNSSEEQNSSNGRRSYFDRRRGRGRRNFRRPYNKNADNGKDVEERMASVAVQEEPEEGKKKAWWKKLLG
ncbi:MAG: Rne/Rng family ribonuclease [Alphaproteobacteria bacterium]|nr:Rne/Rng family ribonuclease [Alphaproteobacteria bacterium]